MIFGKNLAIPTIVNWNITLKSMPSADDIFSRLPNCTIFQSKMKIYVAMGYSKYNYKS